MENGYFQIQSHMAIVSVTILHEYKCVNCNWLEIYVTGFEKRRLPRTQQQDTLFTIKR